MRRSDVVAHAPALPVREVLRRFWPDARPYRRWLPLGLALIAVGVAIETAEIYLFKLVVDEVLVPGDLGPLLPIGLASAGLLILGGAVALADDLLGTWLGERFLLTMRTRVFGHLLTLSPDTLDRRRLGDVLTRLGGDVAAIEAFVLSGVADALAAVLSIGFFVGALFYLQWDLALVSLIVAPLFFLTARRFSGLIKRASREKRRRSGSLGAVAQDTLGNTALVQASNREGAELERYRREGEGVIAAELSSVRIRGVFSPLVDLIELAGILLVVYFGTRAIAGGGLTLGGMLVFIAYLTRLYGPVRDLSSLSNTVFKALAGAERVIELLDERPRVTDGPLRLERVRGAIELDDVWFSYDHDPALRGVTLRVAPGERVALVGASGAGKSTIARMLLRWGDPDSGVVRIDGHDLRELELASAAPQRGAAAAGDARAARQRARQHRLRATGRRPGRDRGGGAGRRRARVHRRPAGRLRHRAGRARPPAVRRPAAADRDRPRAAGRRAGAGARRADHGPRRRARRLAGRPDARPHDARHLARPGADERRRPDRRARRGPRDRARTSRRAARAGRDLRADVGAHDGGA